MPTQDTAIGKYVRIFLISDWVPSPCEWPWPMVGFQPWYKEAEKAIKAIFSRYLKMILLSCPHPVWFPVLSDFKGEL